MSKRAVRASVKRRRQQGSSDTGLLEEEVVVLDQAAVHALDETHQMQKETWDRMDESQRARYEAARQAHFPHTAVKKLVSSVSGESTSDEIAIVLGGMTKLFVGELIEKALLVQAEHKITGALSPIEIKDAFKRLAAEGKLPYRPRPVD